MINVNKDSKIYVAGHRGLVGSAIMRQLGAKGYSNIVTRTHAELDLMNQPLVADFFDSEKPEHVILAAAKVVASMRITPTQQNSSSRILRFKPMSFINLI